MKSETEKRTGENLKFVQYEATRYTSTQEHTTGIKQTAGQIMGNGALVKVMSPLWKVQSFPIRSAEGTDTLDGYPSFIISLDLTCEVHGLCPSSCIFIPFLDLHDVCWLLRVPKKDNSNNFYPLYRMVTGKHHMCFREYKICFPRWIVH